MFHSKVTLDYGKINHQFNSVNTIKRMNDSILNFKSIIYDSICSSIKLKKILIIIIIILINIKNNKKKY